jgi:hypothetical protein
MTSKIMYWIPRVLTIVFILFMTIFSLDVFGGDETFGAKMLGFLVHNIPVLIIIAILIIAWRQEIIGGALLMLAALTGTHYFHSFSGNPGSLVVLAPFFLTGILFILHQVLFPEKTKE